MGGGAGTAEGRQGRVRGVVTWCGGGGQPLSMCWHMPAADFNDALAAIGADMMVEALNALAAGSLVCLPQPVAGVTYAAKIDKREAVIDFTRPATEVHNQIRALSPAPGAWVESEASRHGERIKLLRSSLTQGSGPAGTVIGLTAGISVACGHGAIRILELQRPGK